MVCLHSLLNASYRTITCQIPCKNTEIFELFFFSLYEIVPAQRIDDPFSIAHPRIRVHHHRAPCGWIPLPQRHSAQRVEYLAFVPFFTFFAVGYAQDHRNNQQSKENFHFFLDRTKKFFAANKIKNKCSSE